MTPDPEVSPAELLLGQTLVDGWLVVERYEHGGTGGNFSVGYRVEHPCGRKGFCKALDYMAIFRGSVDTASALEHMTTIFTFERDLLRKCGDFKMSRVIRMLGDGEFRVPGSVIPVSYIIFEFAEYDIRRELDSVEDLEAAMRLRTLHQVATGLSQLHGIRVAHQDLKPSNVLIVDPTADSRSSKIGDLGRATDPEVAAPHDIVATPGDRNYAPPEQLYREIPVEHGPRRLASDLYHLGSLATFMFTEVSMNGLLAKEMHPSHRWTMWPGTYADVMPYVRDAFGRSLAIFREAAPEVVAERLTLLVSYLCEPDPYLRGHPQERLNSPGNQYGLQRVISEFNLLAERAGMRLQGYKV